MKGRNDMSRTGSISIAAAVALLVAGVAAAGEPSACLDSELSFETSALERIGPLPVFPIGHRTLPSLVS